MFGYFKLDKQCPPELEERYKKYYCLLCRSLEKHYGIVSRFFLSYDVTLFMMILGDNPAIEKMEKVPCIGTTKELRSTFVQDIPKKCAALNLLLAAGKMEDDVLDENKWKAKFALKIFKGLFGKARQDFPDVWETIGYWYSQIRECEKRKGTLEDIEILFSNMMVSIATKCFNLEDPSRIKALELASKWLYFIDAVDDLDENLSEHSFNPLSGFHSFHDMKNKHYNDLTNHYRQLYKDMPVVSGGTGSEVINRIIFRGLPEETIRVLTRQGKLF